MGCKFVRVAWFILKFFIFLLIMVSIGKKVSRIGKGSLPWRLSIRVQFVYGVRKGEQKLRSMVVNVLSVVK